MITLCLDTAYKYLTCCIIRDDEIVSFYSEECFKKQSETVFTALDIIFKEAGISKDEIDSVCITEGPGSYTGVRIAMTIAKTLCHVRNIDLYTISTLRLYAGGKENTMVIMNARADRAYVGIYNKDEILLDDCIMTLSEIDPKDYDIVGDGELIGRTARSVNYPLAFLQTKKNWKKAENVAYLVPKYLKESESYLQ